MESQPQTGLPSLRQERLSLRRRRRKRWVRMGTRPSAAPSRMNERWSMDFVSDCLASGQTVRILNIVDDHTRESLAMEVDTSLASLRVVRALETAIRERGNPKRLFVTTGQNSAAGVGRPGVNNERSGWSSSSRASRSRMRSPKALMGGCVTNA